jgi:D-amino-acid dehydrogenase
MTSQQSGKTAHVADVVVLGCGIVGLSIAFQLQRRGLSCLLIDPRGPAGDASFGNAGSVSVGNLFPQAVPGVVRSGLRGLRDPLAPLKLDWPALPHYAGWLWRFARQARWDRVQQSLAGLQALNVQARQAWLDLADALDARDLIGETGYLHVYSEDASFAANAWAREQLRAQGVAHDVLDAAQLRDLEPGIAAIARHGVLQRDSLFVRDPGAFCRRLYDQLCARGAQVLVDQAVALHAEGAGYQVQTLRGAAHVDQVVVAAGAWSRGLLRPLGVRLPVAAARGYHAAYAPQPDLVRRPTLWAERYLVVSPMAAGIRVTGFKEMTAPDRPARPALMQALAPEAGRLYPALQAPPKSIWSGLRPCTPDSLPVLDQLPGERIFVATGHGHLGLTQGPISAELMASRMLGETPRVPMQPYRLDRFGPATLA